MFLRDKFIWLSSFKIIVTRCCFKACSLFTYGSHYKVVDLPGEDENEGKDALVLKRHHIEYPGEDPVLQTHHQDEHLRQQQELHLLAECGVCPPGGRELEPDGANHRRYPR